MVDHVGVDGSGGTDFVDASQQNNPDVASNVTTRITNISGNYELRAAMDTHELQQQQ